MVVEPLSSDLPKTPRATREGLIGEIATLAAGASFEITAGDVASLEEARAFIPQGATISVTALPTDTQDARVLATRAVREAGYEPLPHVAARKMLDDADADRLVSRLAEEGGAKQLFIIGGDVPAPVGPFASALDLVGRLRLGSRSYEKIGFGGYPEGHPAIERKVLESQLDTKIAVIEDAGLEPFIVTQFCFDTRPIVDWLEALRARQNQTLVRIGLAGPASIRTLLRYARICGIGTSARALANHGASLARLLRESGPDPVIRGLAEAEIREKLGPVALHLFPFGGMVRTARWMAPVAEGRLKLRPNSSGFEPVL